MSDKEDRIERLDAWLEQAELEQIRVGPMWVELLRALTEADSPEAWNPATTLTHRFLELVEDELAFDLQWRYAESARLFSILLTILAEAGQYRHETFKGDPSRRHLIDEDLLPKMGKVREHAISAAKQYLSQSVFSSLATDIELEIFPLLDSLGSTSGRNSRLARDRFMPFRVSRVGDVFERLYSFRLRTPDPCLIESDSGRGLLCSIYDCKYARFGTSGVRGRWEEDFTEVRAKWVVQAICDFMKDSDVPDYVGAENLQGKRVVIGYDSRRNAPLVAEWAAQVCLSNGFKVDLTNRDTPTPVLVHYLIDYLDQDDVAGLINCTASHNPPDWQGIKFNPRQGWPAPTSLTDFIAARANQLQLLGFSSPEADLAEGAETGCLVRFDPIVDYSTWVLDSGRGNKRISIDPERIRQHFKDSFVIIDEMHGVSRGYLTRLLGEIGVRHQVIHAERDPSFGDLDYANPEEPFIDALKARVGELDNAILGVGMDADADRFGVVDGDGTYYRPNQILPMLVRYLGIDRELRGRVVVTQTGSPLIEELAGMIPDNEAYKPESGVVPAFIDHPYYQRRVGDREDRVYEHIFMVPVGIKYIEEVRRMDRRYSLLEELPDDWRNSILMGGEESSGLTTRGHVTDKDGVWANLLIMDMLAYYNQPVAEIWKDTTEVAGWSSYGGFELSDRSSNTGRADVDAVLEAKEELINYYLDEFEGKAPGEGTIGGLEVVYAGGIRYDFVEVQLCDAEGNDQHYLRVRSSGTEPINRVYVESSDPAKARRLMETALQRLEELSAIEIQQAHSEWRLVDILSATRPFPKLVQMVNSVIDSHSDWSQQSIAAKLERMLPAIERRNQGLVRAWVEVLDAEESQAIEYPRS